MADTILADNNIKIPKSIEVKRCEIFEIPKNAESVGIALYDLGWPRRKILDRFQLRLEYYLDAGGVFRDHNNDPFSVDDDVIEGRFGDDPGYRWLSEFPGRCKKHGLKNASSLKVQRRLQILDLGLRTPPLGLSI